METGMVLLEAEFPDQIQPVRADVARPRTLAEFPWTAPVELLVTHLALLDATRQKEKGESENSSEIMLH